MKKNNVQKLVICAVLMALHIVLEYVSIRIGNDYKITLSGLPFIVTAVLYGPLTGFGVGLIASFLSQLLTFGITVTTPIWILPGAIHGLTMGLLYVAAQRKRFAARDSFKAEGADTGDINIKEKGRLKGRANIAAFAVCVFISGLVTTICNLIASYFDSKIFGYYKPGYIIALIPIRLVNWALTAVVCSVISILILKALFRFSSDIAKNKG